MRTLLLKLFLLINTTAYSVNTLADQNASPLNYAVTNYPSISALAIEPGDSIEFESLPDIDYEDKDKAYTPLPSARNLTHLPCGSSSQAFAKIKECRNFSPVRGKKDKSNLKRKRSQKKKIQAQFLV